MKLPKGKAVYVGGKGGKGYVDEIPDSKIPAGKAGDDLKNVIEKSEKPKTPKATKDSGKP